MLDNLQTFNLNNLKVKGRKGPLIKISRNIEYYITEEHDFFSHSQY